MDVDILLYDYFDELDAVGPHEVFGHAADFGADVDSRLVTLEETDTVEASHGLRVVPEGVLDPESPPDLLVVPGGPWRNRGERGTWAEVQRGVIPEAIAATHRAGATVGSVCTGGMLLAEAGLTEGRPAVTHHGALEDLRETGAEVLEQRVVDDGDVITAGGVTSGLDLAISLLEREFGPGLAADVEDVLEYERRR